MKRRTRITVLTLVLLPLLAAGIGLYWLGWTESGLQWTADRIRGRLGEAVRIGRVEGQLAGPLTVHGLEVDTPSTRLRLGSATLDWSPWRLLAGHVHVASLQARSLMLKITPADRGGDGEPFRLPERLPVPVDITLDDFHLRQAELQLPGLQKPLRFDSLSFAAKLDNREIRIRGLSARGPDLTADGELALANRMPYHASLTLQAQLHARQLPEADLRLRAEGTVQELAVHADLRGPFRLQLDGRLGELFGQPHWNAQLQLSGLRPAGLRPDWPAFTLDADLQLEGDFASLRAQGGIGLQDTGIGTVNAHLRAGVDADRLRLDSLELRHASLPALLTAQGSLQFNAALAYRLQGNWRELAWPPGTAPVHYSPRGRFTIDGDRQSLRAQLDAATPGHDTHNLHAKLNLDLAPGLPFAAEAEWQALQLDLSGGQWQSPRGQLQAEGTLDGYRGTAKLTARAAGLPAAQLELAAQGDRNGLAVQRLAADWLEGRWELAGKVDWHGTPSWNAGLRVRSANPGVLYPEWPGKVDLQLRAAGRHGDRPHFSLDLRELAGSLRQRELSGHTRLDWWPDARRLELHGLSLALGSSRLQAGGRFAEQFELHASLHAPELRDVWPDANGNLRAEADLTGTREDPRIRLSLAGSRLAWQEFSLAGLRANGELAPESESHFRLQLQGLERPGLDIAALQLDGQGSFADHELGLSATTPAADLRLRLHGGYAGGDWQGVLNRASVQLANSETWQLVEDSALRISGNAVSVERTCLRQTPARLCLAGRWQQGRPWQADLSLLRLPLASLSPWLPGGLQYAGRFDGTAHAEGLGTDRLSARLKLALDAGEVRQKTEGRMITLLRFDTGTLTAGLADNRLTSRLDLQLPEQGSLGAQFNLDPVLSDEPAARRRLDARFTAHTNDFALIPVLVPEIGSFSGELDADLRFGGTLRRPTLTGTAKFRNGTAGLPRQGLKLGDVDLTLQGRGERIRFAGNATSGTGTLQWNLDMQREDAGWKGSGSLTGARFQAMNTPEAWVLVSPQLQLRVADRDLHLDGRIGIPEARITPRDLSGAVEASADQVIVRAGETTPGGGEDWRLFARVTTQFGERVHFAGFGLSADIAGEVTAIEEPGQPTLGQGELRIVNGEYEAYGTRLAITTGRLIYNRVPITQPALDITARREIGDVTVGANVRGTLRNPRLSLFSSPAMRQTEVLSYLVLGRPINEASASDQQRLGSAATSLGLAGGALVAKSLGRQLGIENVSIEATDDPANAALVLGEYLTPRLYVSYGIGLFEAVNTVHLRYELSSKWTLEAESGETSSADFLYTIETD